MKRILFVILLLIVFVSASVAQTASFSQTEPDRMADDFISVSLVVAERGEVLYTILGHACLRLRCPYYDLDYMYSYESEQVRGRVVRFLLNDLKMGMYYISPEEYLDDNRLEGRGVVEYKLNLPAEVETELWRVLDERVNEGKNLEYDYIKRGCTISIVENLDKAVASANKFYDKPVYKLLYPQWDEGFDRTLREFVYDNSPEGWQRFFGMTLVGGQVDNPDLRKKDKLIIPSDLVRVWKQTNINDIPIITEEATVLQPLQHKYNGETFTPLHASLVVLLLALISLFWQKPYIDWCVLALQTVLGCLMLWLLVMPLAGSEWSWLIVPFNPLLAICWKWREKWALWYAVVVALWAVAMMLAPHRLVEYAHLVLALSMAVVCLKQSNRIMKIIRSNQSIQNDQNNLKKIR
ncbi:MAG: DUF4105 domain-containing protein [Paludibacteraceae bacterium]|nr:DUF4105 domain-containing protein [Paludibacteraceae bacterium]